MATFDFNTQTLYKHKEQKFIPLGSKNLQTELESDTLFNKKISYKITGKVDGVWGTLGWEDDSAVALNGTLTFSAEGNTDEGGDHVLTKNEIEDLKQINPLLDEGAHLVHERYINFDDVDFDLPEQFNPVNLPKLRLTLFLQKDEGALVYYQHSRKGDYKDEDALFEYIMYKKEADKNRDRLDYFFPVEPKHTLVPVDEENHIYKQSGEETGLSFIIKILTYKQSVKSETNLYKEAKTHINKKSIQNIPGNIVYELVGEKKYNLLLFKPTAENGDVSIQDPETNLYYGGRFVEVTGAAQVDTGLRTLFLIHGTFVNTMKSFKDIILRKGQGNTGDSYLQQLLKDGDFQQILAFDHPTISHDAKQNTEWLVSRLKELGLSFQNNPVSVFTTSRGALVAEYMAANSACHALLPMKKVLMFSAANGSGYFTTAAYISKGITIWRNSVSGPAAKIVLALAQISIEFFLKQPGCMLMKIDSDRLNYILNGKPLKKELKYQCVVSDWNNSLVVNEKWLKRVGQTTLDLVIKISLGKEHDWVIGAERQKMVPYQSVGYQNAHEYRHAIHGRYLELNYVTDINNDPIADPHMVIGAFFRQQADQE